MSVLRISIIFALVLLAGCSSDLGGGPNATAQFQATPASATPAAAAGAQAAVASNASALLPEYHLVPGDLLDISVFEVPALTQEVQIGDSGLITLPLIGDIRAAGLTTRQLTDLLTQKLRAKYLQSPQVSVFLKASAGQRVTVDGAVKTPGVYPIDGQMTLVQAIAHSGGLTDVADSGAVLVFRNVNGQRMAAKFDVDKIRAGKAADPELQPGDMVIADTSGPKSVWENVKTTLPVFAFFAPLLY